MESGRAITPFSFGITQLSQSMTAHYDISRPDPQASIFAEGPPEDIAKDRNSITGKYLKPLLGPKAQPPK
jgi:hypothetical protein